MKKIKQLAIRAGQGKGRCCDISRYILPFAGTKQQFDKQSRESKQAYRNDNARRDF